MSAASGLTLGFVVGGFVAAGLLVARRATRRSHLASGPSMLVGAYLVGALTPVLV